MNEYFEENKRSLILLASMLFVLAIVLYFMLVRPIMVDYKKEVEQIDQLNEEITLLETQIESLQEASEDFDVEDLILENKIPTKRELDEYILALQALELHTESAIETIQFTYDSSIETEDLTEDEEDTTETEETEDLEDPTDEAEVTEDETEETDEEAQEEEDEEEADEESEEDENPAPTIDPEILSEKPENLHVMTVRISVVSPDFDEFIELLKLIEHNERISIVTNLNFTKPTEEDIYFSDESLDEIPFDAEITTFYYEE